MRIALFALAAACLLASGCKAMNSLIFHPLHVLHEQHEYNEKEKHRYEAINRIDTQWMNETNNSKEP